MSSNKQMQKDDGGTNGKEDGEKMCGGNWRKRMRMEYEREEHRVRRESMVMEAEENEGTDTKKSNQEQTLHTTATPSRIPRRKSVASVKKLLIPDVDPKSFQNLWNNNHNNNNNIACDTNGKLRSTDERLLKNKDKNSATAHTSVRCDTPSPAQEMLLALESTRRMESTYDKNNLISEDSKVRCEEEHGGTGGGSRVSPSRDVEVRGKSIEADDQVDATPIVYDVVEQDILKINRKSMRRFPCRRRDNNGTPYPLEEYEISPGVSDASGSPNTAFGSREKTRSSPRSQASQHNSPRPSPMFIQAINRQLSSSSSYRVVLTESCDESISIPSPSYTRRSHAYSADCESISTQTPSPRDSCIQELCARFQNQQYFPSCSKSTPSTPSAAVKISPAILQVDYQQRFAPKKPQRCQSLPRTMHACANEGDQEQGENGRNTATNIDRPQLIETTFGMTPEEKLQWIKEWQVTHAVSQDRLAVDSVCERGDVQRRNNRASWVRRTLTWSTADRNSLKKDFDKFDNPLSTQETPKKKEKPKGLLARLFHNAIKRSGSTSRK